MPSGQQGAAGPPWLPPPDRSQLALDWALMTASSRVRGPGGLLPAEPGGSGVPQASFRRPPRGLLVSWQWLQVPGLGLSAAAPARVETGLPSHAVAPSSEPGGSLPEGRAPAGQTAAQRLLPSLHPRAPLSVSPQIQTSSCAHVARLEFPHETGLILRCAAKVMKPFQTKQRNRPSCGDQEGRSGSSKIVWMKAQHEGALTPPCIVRKDPWVPHTARRGA